MKRYSNLERATALLGILFVIAGSVMIIHPIEFIEIHDTTNGRAEISSLGPDKPEVVSKTGARVGGVLTVVMGAAITCFALIRSRD